ncbi:unnamed protein product [Dibothriocephalus latus]|uniref:Exportin-T n=1 Tax=Dibothriocephalus latus TaxID=60516 RepID=A0A3P6Q0B0_DIBLA|nr:unnamed protein product [Dibothriocephalus latus]
MQAYLESLRNVSMLGEHESVVNQQKLIELIEHLSSTQNWELCSSFLVENMESCDSLAALNSFQNSAAFFVCCRSVELFIKAPKSHPDLASLFGVFLEILKELDSFVLNRDVQLTSDEVSRANSIKDSMRVSCLPAIIHTITQFMQNLGANEHADSELISSSLKILGLYASWIDVSLIVNIECFSILRTLVCCPTPSLLTSVCQLLKGLVCKGMAPFPDKLSLIIGIWSESLEPMMSVPVIARAIANAPRPHPSDPRLAGLEDECSEVTELLEDFSTLIGSIGYNLVEAYRFVLPIC